MRYFTKIYLGRWIVNLSWLAGFGLVLWIQRVVFQITLDASQATMVIGMVFTGVSYGLSRVIASWWISNLDTVLYEMGDKELETYGAMVQQAIEDRNVVHRTTK